MTIQNLISADPELKDVLSLFRRDIFLNLNCHAIGKIQLFNPLNQTATVSINYLKTFLVPDITGVYVNKMVSYPLLGTCPVICLGGGNTAMTFPITTGDDCLVFFNDRDMDNWYSGSSTSGVNTPRMHSISDAIVLVGLRSQNNVLPNYNPTDAEFRTKDGLTKIAIKADGSKVTITVGPFMTFEIDETGKIKATNTTFALGDLITAIFNLFTQSTVLGLPLITPPNDLAVLASFKP